MSRQINGRPLLRATTQQFNATRADELIGVKTQQVNDGTATATVAVDAEANLHVSRESTTAFSFTGCDLSKAATPLIERTFKRAVGATQNVTITLAQQIDGNTSYVLASAGASLSVMPVETSAPGVFVWAVKSATGTVNAVP
jgi:hypothetical protein